MVAGLPARPEVGVSGAVAAAAEEPPAVVGKSAEPLVAFLLVPSRFQQSCAAAELAVFLTPPLSSNKETVDHVPWHCGQYAMEKSLFLKN